ncbi:metallo-hydrolase/oxidoreductase superfamily protein [Artemisia annua]|uniref:Metallo-hydrolase/oxidoreductase superfamily protein n=2 Tax=Magnoliopsida TaxID=3398 RepID=A0A2U1MRQ3_ARTAN|nr:metallo-hydrolase/oxidoreductase superfamily protein [Artemisia annua]
MSYLLQHLHNGWAVDQAILAEEERLVVIRFGHDWDETSYKAVTPLLLINFIMDEVLSSVADTLKNFAVIYLVDITEVPDFNTMYELYDPSTVMFFFRNKHIMIDLGTGNNNKINWAMKDKQEFIDIVETVYRGARKGRGLVIAPKDYSTNFKVDQIVSECSKSCESFFLDQYAGHLGCLTHIYTTNSWLVFKKGSAETDEKMILTYRTVGPFPSSLTRLTRTLSFSNPFSVSLSTTKYAAAGGRRNTQFNRPNILSSEVIIRIDACSKMGWDSVLVVSCDAFPYYFSKMFKPSSFPKDEPKQCLVVSCAQKGEQVSPDQPELIFIGTGTSEGIPRVSCLTNPLKKCKITPLPVWHGRNYRSLGFRFGNVCYISDVSGIPEETYPLLEDCDLLIMDALRPDRSSSTHFGLPKALEEVRKIKPKRTLFTGMMHLMDHEIVNEGLLKLKESEGLDYQEDMFSSTNEISSSASLHSLPSVQKGEQVSTDQPELIFIGTGSSEGIPRVSCLTNPLKKCEVCSKAVEPGNKNRRLNTSVLIRYPRPSGTCNILIDAGKFFYQSALRWFPTYGIRTLDAVVITHSHADAIGGLDDLRDWTNNVQPHIPIYVAERDFEVMKKTHYYLVDTSVVTPGTAVSELQFAIIQEKPFTVHDLKVQLHFLDTLEQLFNITPLPVWHGRDYRSLGFRFGNVCYISDVSEIPEETYPLLEDCDLLIMDALRPDRSSSTHFGLPKVEFHELFSFGVSINTLYHVGALMLVLTLGFGRRTKNQAKKNPFHSKEILLDLFSVINVDMMHLMDHEIVNEGLLKLKESEGLDVQLSYDGLRVPIDL